MTLVKCPDCSSDVSTSARECAQCGCPVGPQPARGSNQLIQGLALLLFMAVTIGVVAVVASPSEDRSSSVEDDDVHGAWAYAQQFVKQDLKAPSTAEFPFGGYRHVQPLGDGRYRVTSYVDAQNSFGAALRTHFEAVLRRAPDRWELESLQIRD